VAQLAGSGPVVTAGEDPLDLSRRGSVKHASFVAGASEVCLGEHGGQVDEGSRDGGDWDASPPNAVGQISSTNAVRDYTADSALGCRQNFGQ
jgi:hypothetical protein